MAVQGFLLLLLSVSCAAKVPSAVGGSESASAGGPAAQWNAALAAQPAPPLLITADLTQQFGDWPNDDAAGDRKEALAAGRWELDPSATPPVPQTQEIQLGGAVRTVQVQTAEAALAAASAGSGGSCDDCPPLRLRDPVLVDVEVPTVLGPASVPAWRFRVADTDVRITRVAVDPTEYLSVDGLEYGPIGSGSTAQMLSDQRLRISFVGSLPADVGPCGADYSGGSAVNGRVVTVRIVALPHPAPADLTCAAVAALRTVDIDLGEPLGDRILIDGAGFAIPRT